MLPYWILFVYFALGSFWTAFARDSGRTPARLAFGAGLLAIVILLGLRYKVGPDFANYLSFFRMMRFWGFGEALTHGDPAYQALNWVVYQLGAGIWLVNLVCGLIVAWGLARFASTQPNPWLVVLVAIPYFINVVAMGYTRQGVAIGLILAGLAALFRGKGLITFTAYVFAAALFHKTAICVLPLVLLVSKRARITNIVAIAVITWMLFTFLLRDSMQTYMRSYIELRYASQGAATRVAMSALAATLFLIRRKEFRFDERQARIWLNFSFAAFAAPVMLLISPSTTAVDRVSLYLIPLQLAILAQIPYVYTRRGLGTAAVVTYSGAVQYVWLNFGAYAPYFVYHLYPFGWVN